MPSQIRHGLIPGALSAFLYLILPLSGGIGLLPGLIAPMPVVFAALAGGQTGGLIAIVAGAVGAMAAGGLDLSLGYIVSAGGPGLLAGLALLSTRTAEDGRVEHRGVEALVLASTLYAMVCLMGALAYLAGGVGIEASLRLVFDETLAQMPPELVAQGMGEDVRKQMIGLMVSITPGGPLAVMGAALVANGIWASRFAAKRGLLNRPQVEFAGLRLPDGLFVAFAGCFLAAQLAEGDIGFMAGQASLVLAMPFLLAGLSVIHAVTAGKPGRGIMLGFAYGLLILGFWPAVMTVVGLVDHVFGLKARFGAAGSGKDEE